MKLTVEIQRVGQSRVSMENIPLFARVLQGGKSGENLLAGQGFRDVDCAKDHLRTMLNSKFGREVDIDWVESIAGDPDALVSGSPLQVPLERRPGYREESAATNKLSGELGALARRHRLSGAVLVSFTEDRVGINTSGTPLFARVMEKLGDRILEEIDGGVLRPEELESRGEKAVRL